MILNTALLWCYSVTLNSLHHRDIALDAAALDHVLLVSDDGQGLFCGWMFASNNVPKLLFPQAENNKQQVIEIVTLMLNYICHYVNFTDNLNGYLQSM